MANKTVEICIDNCPDRYDSHEDIEKVVAKQESLGNTSIKSEKCLGVCSLIGSSYPPESVVNVRVSGGEHNQMAAVIIKTPEDQLRTVPLK